MLFGQRAAFWVAVGVVSVLSQFALEAVTQRVGTPGLAQFTAYAHAKSPGQ